MEKKKSFLQIYLWITLFFGFLGLLDNTLNFFNLNHIFSTFVVIVAFSFFIFNIVALIIFFRSPLKKIYFVLPIYHLLTYIFFVGLGIYLLVSNLTLGWITLTLIITGIITSIFEIVFSIYLLKKPLNF
jgi:hypothetical protein